MSKPKFTVNGRNLSEVQVVKMSDSPIHEISLPPDKIEESMEPGMIYLTDENTGKKICLGPGEMEFELEDGTRFKI